MPMGSNLSDEERSLNMTESKANKAYRLSFLAPLAYFPRRLSLNIPTLYRYGGPFA